MFPLCNCSVSLLLCVPRCQQRLMQAHYSTPPPHTGCLQTTTHKARTSHSRALRSFVVPLHYWHCAASCMLSRHVLWCYPKSIYSPFLGTLGSNHHLVATYSPAHSPGAPMRRLAAHSYICYIFCAPPAIYVSCPLLILWSLTHSTNNGIKESQDTHINSWGAVFSVDIIM